MKESEQRALLVKVRLRAFIRNNAVNVRIVPRAISQRNVLMAEENQNVGIVAVVNTVNILASDAFVRIAMEPDYVLTIGQQTNVLNVEIVQFVSIKNYGFDARIVMEIVCAFIKYKRAYVLNAKAAVRVRVEN